jgi:ketosteroid isomerase-like protein
MKGSSMNSETVVSGGSEEFQATLLELHHAITKAEVKTYRQLVSEAVTCFEPETGGAQVKGIDMHIFFVKNSTAPDYYYFDIIDPTFNVCGDMAYAAYTFLLAEISDGKTTSTTENVTRIFQKKEGTWKMVHFHRSA